LSLAIYQPLDDEKHYQLGSDGINIFGKAEADCGSKERLEKAIRLRRAIDCSVAGDRQIFDIFS